MQRCDYLVMQWCKAFRHAIRNECDLFHSSYPLAGAVDEIRCEKLRFRFEHSELRPEVVRKIE